MKNEFHKRIISSIILLPLAFFVIIKGSYYYTTILFLFFFISIYEWYFISKNKINFFLGNVFFIFSFFCIYNLRLDLENEYLPFLVALSICILTDTGGYVFGKIFKGPKLTIYSPNKTYAGLLGSYLFSFILLPFLNFFNIVSDHKNLSLLIFIILISTISQLGDIIISYFKRKAKMKDTGKLIPGHGGLLDRIDGIIFALPVAYILFQINFFKILE